MKVQQHRKHADAMPACGSQQHINVSQHPVVDAGWNAVIVETHSGSRIAQKEYSHDGNAVTSKRGEGLIQQVQCDGLVTKSSAWEPPAGADIRAVADPWKVDADNEPVRFACSPH